LTKCHSKQHIIYADDTSQDVSGKSIDTIEYKLKEDLVNSMQWMKRNKLTMNLKKTQCVLIGTKQRWVKCRKICIEINFKIIRAAFFLSLKILSIFAAVFAPDHIVQQ
jgi:hypothetical protein